MHDLFVVASLCRTLQVYMALWSIYIYIYTVIFSDVYAHFFLSLWLHACILWIWNNTIFIFFSRLTLKLGDPDQYKRTISPWYNYIIIPIYILYIRQETSRLRAPALIQPYFHFWFIVCTFHAVGTSAAQSSTNFVTCSMLCFFRHTYCVISLF